MRAVKKCEMCLKVTDDTGGYWETDKGEVISWISFRNPISYLVYNTKHSEASIQHCFFVFMSAIEVLLEFK